MRKWLCVTLLLGSAAATFAAPWHFRSGSAQVALLELYTSEGCSSCPPADRWFSNLRDAHGLWKDFVPVSFHVDYWNRLGWTDRFSASEYTQRQYALAESWNSRTVYTPEFVRNGAEWKPPLSLPADRGPTVGVLDLLIDDAGRIVVEFAPSDWNRDEAYTIHVALLGSGFASRVTAGENRGETLRHDFVVLGLNEADLASDGDVRTAILPLPESTISPIPRRAIAAWVTRNGSLTPLQATGGWLE